MLLAVCHSAATGWVEVDDLSKVSDLRAKSGNLLWAEADVRNLSRADVDLIAEEFSLHPLAVEDAIRTRQRPKLEAYEDQHLFVVFHELNEINGQLEASQISCFVGERYLLTLHAGAERTIGEGRRRWSKEWDGRDSPGYLLHTLLDALVDDFEAIADRLESLVEELEETTLENPTAPLQRSLYSVKQRVSRLRRYALPTERVVQWLVEGPGRDLFPKEALQLFGDVRDHILRTGDQVRSIDDIADAVIDLRRGEQAALLNETTKRLTGWAAIIAVPTFIASVYGMNFQLVPPDGKIFGFFFALFLMALSSAFLYVYFKRRDWI